jgi:hypothetical protein
MHYVSFKSACNCPYSGPKPRSLHCLQNDRFIKASGKITVYVTEIKFVSKIKGDATTLISLNPLTTVHFCSLKIHHRYDWKV